MSQLEETSERKSWWCLVTSKLLRQIQFGQKSLKVKSPRTCSVVKGQISSKACWQEDNDASGYGPNSHAGRCKLMEGHGYWVKIGNLNKRYHLLQRQSVGIDYRKWQRLGCTVCLLNALSSSIQTPQMFLVAIPLVAKWDNMDGWEMPKCCSQITNSLFFPLRLPRRKPLAAS